MKGAPYRRQISLIERENWDAAMAQAGLALPWQVRRANLLVEGLGLPRKAGTRLRIGATCVIEITCECDPCARMDAIAEGLRKALEPDWRGGFLGQVITDGEIATGDTIRIEE
ncbi:MAG: MOSC domain-containing protein [Novosphingobium sp.]